MQLQGVNINDNEGLEREADLMGRKIKKNSTNKNSYLSNDYIKNSNQVLQSKWIELYTNHIIWDKLINGVRWYSDDAGKTIYYVIEDESVISDELKKNYKEHERECKAYDDWDTPISENEGYDPPKIVNEKAALGMEIELRNNLIEFKTKSPTPEDQIKAIAVSRIAEDKVDVTFDTQSGYNENEAGQNLVIELVFNASKIPINETDFEKLQEDIINGVKNITYGSLKKFADSKETVNIQGKRKNEDEFDDEDYVF